MTIGKALRTLRGSTSQLQLSMELNVSRESISAYETGRSKLPPDISKLLIKKYNDPFLAMTIANEYTGAWCRKLDGPNVDLHRCSVKDKVVEEVIELTELLQRVSLSSPPKAISDQQRKEVEELALQSIDLIVALNHFVAVMSNEYQFDWQELWDKQLTKLIAKGYIKRK
ncbi:helix-turn-helix domain-containing protein [Anaerobacillus sp. MEB173]|uniref:helix-turn-helix domain-containing protein n=1 Tax=Anaerobacillus sp. MEB173 TaxID=3383345 RepID=UPI003F926CFA